MVKGQLKVKFSLQMPQRQSRGYRRIVQLFLTSTLATSMWLLSHPSHLPLEKNNGTHSTGGQSGHSEEEKHLLHLPGFKLQPSSLQPSRCTSCSITAQENRDSRKKFQNSKIVPAHFDKQLGAAVGCSSFLIMYSVPTRRFP